MAAPKSRLIRVEWRPRRLLRRPWLPPGLTLVVALLVGDQVERREVAQVQLPNCLVHQLVSAFFVNENLGY